MKESMFRQKLVKSFRTKNPNSFIWVSDVHFKSGFPDIYAIVGGKHLHVELKVCKSVPAEPANAFSKIQLVTARKIVEAGGRALGFVYALSSKQIFLFNLGKNPVRFLGHHPLSAVVDHWWYL